MIRDDFAGAGGFSLGAVLANIEHADVAVGVESWEPAVQTARAAGFMRHHRTVQDVRSYDWGLLDGYTAGPPCQTFSVAGKGTGRPALDDLVAAAEKVAQGALPENVVQNVTDVRTLLVLEPLLVIWRHRPRWVVLEQVRAVKPVWDRYAELLADRFGYSVATGIVSAEQYGVPQTRKRAVLVARLDGKVAALPTPTHSAYHPRTPKRLDAGVKPWVSMAEALGWDSDADVALRSNYGTGGNASNRGTRSIDLPAPTVTSKVDRNLWVHRRPSTTIVGTFRPDVVAAPGWRRPGDGPRQNAPGSIRVTIEQAGMLQSFPADYPWQGTQGQRFQQIGNAIPPLLAAALIEAAAK